MAKTLPRLLAFAEAVRRDGIQHVVLRGMGGASLAPEVMRAVLGGAPGAPPRTARITSGARLAPPMPRSTTCWMPSRRTASANASRRGRVLAINAEIGRASARERAQH